MEDIIVCPKCLLALLQNGFEAIMELTEVEEGFKCPKHGFMTLNQYAQLSENLNLLS
jgi:uncharacterized protein (DUF2225 family)